ncbi:ATP-binding protein [Streptomyces zhihengii]|uniref:ATP-binding protein n=1 Tax=Streptomyces zhihengii TaxID=1818004 RepID=UPI0033B9C75F
MTIHLPHRVSSGTGHEEAFGHAGTEAVPPARSTEFCGHAPPCALGGFAACGLDGNPRNAGQARRFVSTTLDGWALPQLAGDMHLLVTELVTNAVCHALGPGPREGSDYPVWLGLFRHPRHVVCAVTDPSPEPPRPRAADASSPGGRGLALIGALCDTWSWCPTAPHGKTVWATLPLPAPAG